MALWRCCQSGVRRLGSRLGSNRARAAHSRNRDANSAEPAYLGGDHRLDLVGIEDDEVGAGRLGIGVRQANHDSVVGMHGLRFEPIPFAQASADRQRPRCVDRCSEGRVHHQSPVAQLVAESLDQNRSVVRQVAGGGALIGQIAQADWRCPIRRDRRREPVS